MDTRDRRIQNAAWLISVGVALIAVIAWGQAYRWRIFDLTPYQYFPLFGLLAYTLMWSHYVAYVIRSIAKVDKRALKTYFEVTSLVVLVAICLHPGIFLWQLWRDGAGLPPKSYYSYVMPSLRWVVTLGLISLLVFLAYEFRRLYESKPWWKYVSYATDAAMLAIFYHGLQLGSQLQAGWFQAVWWFMGITLLVSLAFIHVPTVRKWILSVKIS